MQVFKRVLRREGGVLRRGQGLSARFSSALPSRSGDSAVTKPTANENPTPPAPQKQTTDKGLKRTQRPFQVTHAQEGTRLPRNIFPKRAGNPFPPAWTPLCKQKHTSVLGTHFPSEGMRFVADVSVNSFVVACFRPVSGSSPYSGGKRECRRAAVPGRFDMKQPGGV